MALVRVRGLEPLASCSQSRRATNCATPGYYATRWSAGWLIYERPARGVGEPLGREGVKPACKLPRRVDSSYSTSAITLYSL